MYDVDGGLRPYEPERYLSNEHRSAIHRGMRRYWQSQPLCADCGKVRVRRWSKGYCYRCKVKREKFDEHAMRIFRSKLAENA
ncbi:hypothetical protein LCGC14_1875030 [marine sediment metagenome]|uniref:Uncharacterized protein n=1 Tax=marine sediment metagenome TaxID=412755 RepID=A0A0F9J2M4_9ZZZZ